jgi:hypothetical protein
MQIAGDRRKRKGNVDRKMAWLGIIVNVGNKEKFVDKTYLLIEGLGNVEVDTSFVFR